MAGETGAVGVLDTGIAAQSESFSLDGQFDPALGIQFDLVAQL